MSAARPLRPKSEVSSRRRRRERSGPKHEAEREEARAAQQTSKPLIPTCCRCRCCATTMTTSTTSTTTTTPPATMLLLFALLVAPLISGEPQANSFNQQQFLASQLQVFNGNESLQSANHFKLMETHDDHLLVGARNVIYNISLTTMREVMRLEWPPTEDDVRLCRMKGKSAEQCQNYIRVMKLQAAGQLYVCGTNAYKPRCRRYTITPTGYNMREEEIGEGQCPYQENQNITSIIVDGALYTGTAAQFSGIDGLIHKSPLRTEQYNPKQLNSPNFVNSFQYGEHVYFLFRESAIEHINCGKTIYSRIARVCKNDSGGSRGGTRHWTSFVKARLNCSIPGEYPFYFDEIQSSTQIIASSSFTGAGQSASSHNQQQQQQQSTSANNDLLYAVFTTPTNSIGGSAVCAFRMSDILSAFEGPFKSQADSNSNWLPVPDGKVPSPRPGSCELYNDSRSIPEENINFIKENPLMDTVIESVWSQPLVMMASINFRFTQIAVDAQVETQPAIGAPQMRTDVIFVATDDGRVFKLINTHHLFASNTLQATQASALTASRPLLPASNGRRPALHYNPAAGRLGGLSTSGQPLAAPQVSAELPPVGFRDQMMQQQQQQQQPQQLPDISGSTIVIEELHLFDSRTPIVNMMIHHPNYKRLLQSPYADFKPKLIVLSGKQIKAIPLARCERALACADCLALYDPYCTWDVHRQVCQSSGHSASWQQSLVHQQYMALSESSVASQQLSPFNPKMMHTTPTMAAGNGAWHLPNNNLAPLPFPLAGNNHSLAWWSAGGSAQCPSLSGDQQATGGQQATSVGAPYRSLFSSHLQVPSRFDYASGHHLSHALSLAPMQSSVSIPYHRQQPASECLTFCGGAANLYQPQLGGGVPVLGGSSGDQMAGMCADYMQSHYVGSLPTPGQSYQLNGITSVYSPGQNNLYYTSENLYMAVILGSLAALLLGLVFGFVLGRSHKKHDSSVCSSTFDETNLYMASTGSTHHGGVTNLFAVPPLIPSQQHRPLLQNGASNNGSLLLGTAPGSNGLNHLTNQRLNSLGHNQHMQMNMSHMQQQPLYDVASTQIGVGGSDCNNKGIYGNNQQQQQVMQLHLSTNSNVSGGGGGGTTTVRTGNLPPIPQSANQHQINSALVNNHQNNNQHHQASQLTPNGSSASSTNTSSTSATLPASDQMYLNHQLIQQHQPSLPQPQTQRSFKGQHQRNNSNGGVLPTNGNSNGSAQKLTNHRIGDNSNLNNSNNNQQVGTGGKLSKLNGSIQHQQQAQLVQANNKIYL